MLQPHRQNLKLSVSVKQIQPCEFQEPLYTQHRILFPKWKITDKKMNTDKKNEKKKTKTKPNLIWNQTPNLWFQALCLCKFSLYTSTEICPRAIKWVHHSLGYTLALVYKNNILSMAWGIIQHTNLMRTIQDFASSIEMRGFFFLQ